MPRIQNILSCHGLKDQQKSFYNGGDENCTQSTPKKNPKFSLFVVKSSFSLFSGFLSLESGRASTSAGP